MRQRGAIALFLFVSALLTVLSERATAQTGRVNGLVRDEGGQPIKGATITAENTNIGQSFTATTDDKGRFAMIGLRAGVWRFIAQAPGFGSQAGQASIRMGAPNPPITFALSKSGNAAFGALGGIAARDLQGDLARADALFAERRWDAAIAAYREIIDRSPALAFVNLQVAAAYRNKQEYDAALAAYDNVLKADPHNEKALVASALTQIDRNASDAAEAKLMAAVQGGATGRELYYTLAELKLAKGDAREAVGYYEKAAAADPAWCKPLYKLGMQAIQQGDKNGGAKFMTQVIAVDPTSPEAMLAQAALDSLNR